MPKVGFLIFPFMTPPHFGHLEFTFLLKSTLKLYWLMYSLSSQLLHSLAISRPAVLSLATSAAICPTAIGWQAIGMHKCQWSVMPVGVWA